MNKPNHNPGPWAAFDKDGKCLDCDNWWASSDDHGSTQHQPILDSRSKVIALVVSRSRSPWDDAPDTDANARLIAAAPDLLEALQELMEWQVKNVKVWDNSAYDNAAKVVARAIGEQA